MNYLPSKPRPLTSSSSGGYFGSALKPLFVLCYSIVRLPFVVAALLYFVGCDKSDDSTITVYRILKETMPLGTARQPAASAGVPATVHWPAPEGWEKQPASGFRKGSFIVRGAGGETADISIISFPQEAGGLLANLNRWRDQLKLAPISDVAKAGSPMAVGGRDLFFVDLVSEQALAPDGSKTRILGGVFPVDGETWFFKMMGPDALVESQRAQFKKFLQGVHLTEAREAPAPATMSTNVGGNDTNAPTSRPIEAAPNGRLQYTLPAAWREKPLSPMRLASFEATAPNGKEMDVSVVALPGMAGGDLANVNRWRSQLQLGPIDNGTLVKSVEYVEANGHEFRVIDLVSNQPINGEKQRILASILDENERSWFIKMTGEDAAVESQKSAFIDFLRGLQIP